MREKLISSHVCLAHALYEHGAVKESRIMEWTQKDLAIVCEFVGITCNTDMDPSIEYVLSCISLIADLVITDKNRLQPISRKFSQLRDLLEKLKNVTNLSSSVRETLTYVEDTLFK